ncbi:MAG: glutamyl-tRNA reductase [Actinomycetota bacterium]|nr:glutamyl-tRNA reductase [Actinomycetota bacterium]
MSVLALGLSYRRAPVELLERLAIAPGEEPKAYRRLADVDSVGEAVVLSTCNRVEVYAEVDGYHTGFQDLKRFLSETGELTADELAEPLYSHYEDQAAEHLFSVAAGLDSMVLGEPQILSQVRAAFKRAWEEGSAGPELRGLFERAVRAGRRVRAETGLGARPAALVEAGLSLAAEHLGGLQGRPGLVIGAGEMGNLSLRALQRSGAGPLVELGRRPERAERLARRAGTGHGSIEMLPEAMRTADVVVSSTAATGPVVSRAVVEASARGRRMFLLDLAVPRDVEADAAEVAGVRLADIDDLGPALAAGRGSVDDEVAAARAIVEEETTRFRAARRARRLTPVIQALRRRGEDVRADELDRMASRLARLPERDRRAVEALTERIVSRLLHEPTVRLKELAERDDAPARLLADLFDLHPEA